MVLFKMATLSALVATVVAECVIHEMDHVYYNISDLGLAAFDNRAADVDDLVAAGCDVNYNGTAKLMVYSFSENEYEYGDYDDSYGEYGDDQVILGGLTALHIAATEGYHDMVSELLEVPGIKVDPTTDTGNTPLFDASSWGYTKVIKLLHEAGADLDHQTFDYGLTPLIQTCAYGYMHSAKFLVKIGADLNVQDFYQYTALHVAVHFGYPDLAEFLVKSGADMGIRSIDNLTALELAVELEDREMEQILRLAEELY